jgi:hypothetical protein
MLVLLNKFTTFAMCFIVKHTRKGSHLKTFATMDATIFNENEIKTILVNVVKELYPFYREIKPWVAIYSKDKFLNLDNEYVSLKVNYDNFGKIFIKDGKLVARGGFRGGIGVQMDVDSIEQGIRTLIKSYFNIR